DVATAMALDGGRVYVTGWSLGAGTYSDYATIKYDVDGTELWTARYNGPADRDDWAFALVLDGKGYVYVAGTSTGIGTGLDYATIKYDADGNEWWVARYDGPGHAEDVATALALTATSQVCVTGASCVGLDARGFCTGSAYATIKYVQSK